MAAGSVRAIMVGVWFSGAVAMWRSTAVACNREICFGHFPDDRPMVLSLPNTRFSRGAMGVVTHSPSVRPVAGRFVVQVDDAVAALWRLAAWRRDQFQGTIVNVAGSVGKTTTRQMIDCALRSHLRGTSSQSNFNNYLGVPLSLLQVEPDHDYAIIELGASAEGEIGPLAELSRPDVGVIARLADAHLEGFGGPEGVIRGKAELIAKVARDGMIVSDEANDALEPYLTRCDVTKVRVGRRADCDLTAHEIRHSDGNLRFRVEDETFRLPVWGRHWLNSALAAIAVGRYLKISLGDMAASLASFSPPPRRCEVVRWRDAWLIDDTYNACPASMRVAMELLHELSPQGRRVVVAGEMCELGDWSTQAHRRVGIDAVRVAGADVLLAYGEQAEHVVAGAESAGMPRGRAVVCHSRQGIVKTLRSHVRSGDAILVKGSRVTGMHVIVDELMRGRSRSTSTRGRRVIRRKRTIGVPSTVPSLRERGTTLPPG